MKLERSVLTCVWLLAASGWACAGEVAVAVAANFSAPMEKIATAFAQDTGHKALLSFGATGKLYAQIVHGAPFGVLLAADEGTPQKLAQQGLADDATRMTYATGRLVLWSRQSGVVDAEGKVLERTDWRHLAVANPKLAPYGVAALQTIDKLGVRARVNDRIVQGENIAQAYQFVASGNAELGFVALSQVMDNGRLREGSAWVVPAHLHSPIRQDAIVLAPGRDNPAAAALMQYLRSEKARAVIQSYGYEF